VPPRSSLAPKDPEERRRRILAAAVDVLTDKGFAGTRIADVAAAAGTSPALVVYHFGTLDGALAEALGSVEDAFYADLADATGADADAVERLRALGALACQTGPAVGSWALWMEVWVRALHDGQARALARALDARWKQTLFSVVDDGIWEGVFTCPDPGAAIARLASLMDGLAVQVSLRDPEMTSARMTELWLTSAALELGVPVADVLPARPSQRRGGRSTTAPRRPPRP
jgi:AcrR family transcriptional regulator